MLLLLQKVLFMPDYPVLDPLGAIGSGWLNDKWISSQLSGLISILMFAFAHCIGVALLVLVCRFRASKPMGGYSCDFNILVCLCYIIWLSSIHCSAYACRWFFRQ